MSCHEDPSLPAKAVDNVIRDWMRRLKYWGHESNVAVSDLTLLPAAEG